MKTLKHVLRDAADAEALAAAHLAELLKDMAPGRLQLVVSGLEGIARRNALDWLDVLKAIDGAKP